MRDRTPPYGYLPPETSGGNAGHSSSLDSDVSPVTNKDRFDTPSQGGSSVDPARRTPSKERTNPVLAAMNKKLQEVSRGENEAQEMPIPFAPETKAPTILEKAPRQPVEQTPDQRLISFTQDDVMGEAAGQLEGKLATVDEFIQRLKRENRSPHKNLDIRRSVEQMDNDVERLKKQLEENGQLSEPMKQRMREAIQRVESFKRMIAAAKSLEIEQRTARKPEPRPMQKPMPRLVQTPAPQLKPSWLGRFGMALSRLWKKN